MWSTLEFLEANATSKEDGRMGNFDSGVEKWVLVGYSSTRKTYKCYNLRLNKVVESINVTIDEIGIPKSKKEENKSMEQLFEEEDEKKKKRKMKMKRIQQK